MRVWIDLANSPHVLLFAPVARGLEDLGHEVVLTARDNAQTVELARERWPSVEVIGGPTPGGRPSKGRTALDRMHRLASWARRARPDVALSHNSYAQIAAARALGIRAVTAMDYEHQPANHLAFRLAHTVLLPAVLAETDVRRMGAAPRKRRFYDGLKEELYLGDFTPDPGVLQSLGTERGPGTVVVVARTPPTGALYHRSGNPLFGDVLRKVSAVPQARCVVLARRQEQRDELAALGLPNLILPERAVDSRSLLFAADLVIGAGGTMTREAALLGVPTASVFAGRTAAVDRSLERRGSLRLVRRPEELPPVRPRAGPPPDPQQLRARSDHLIDEFLAAVLEPGEASRRRRPLRGPRPDQPDRTADAMAADARATAQALARWGAQRGWRGSDPYEGLNATSPVVYPLKRYPLGRRLLIQAVKRSPADLRPLLGIRPEANAASVAWAVSALARNRFLGREEAAGLLTDAVQTLLGLRLAGREEHCWGYPFDVQTRVFFYSRRVPNTIATSFAGHALLDAHEALGDTTLLEKARSAGRFFRRHVPQTECATGAYFGYLPEDRSPIHNSNLLAASLLARLAATGGHDDGFVPAAEAAVRYSVAHQRPDGSWPYGERADLGWVDNFHTGYVLDALRACADAGVAAAEAESAWSRGLAYYRSTFFLEDGTPKYYSDRVFPLDAQSAAQGIQTLSIAAATVPSCADQARQVYRFARRRMWSEDGLPLFQRHRHWANRASHFRWVIAPALLALAHLLEAEGRTRAAVPSRAVMAAI